VQSARMLRAHAVPSLARSRIAQAVVTAVLSLLFGWLLSIAELLIVATLAGQGIGLLMMRRALQPYPIAPLARGQVRELLSRQRRFALYTLPSDLLSASSAQMPIFLLATIFGPAAAGTFLLAQRVLLMPLSVIGSAVTDVYKTDASRLYAQSGTCAALTRKALAALGALAVVPAVVLLLWSPALFATIFGEEWRPAGVLCQILAIPALLRLVATPISYNFYLAQRQAEDLVAQAYGVASMLGIFAFVHLRNLGLYECIVLYGSNLTLIYGYYALRSLALATAPKATAANAARPTADS
jgi:O-antigen/teichoic acid export membrane protein